jgi:PilZ domain-containing protein
MQRSRYPERRSTVRVSLQVPLTVRCLSPEGDTIYLKASTHTVSAHGAMVIMEESLMPGQAVRVYNEMTSDSIDCYVTSVRQKRGEQERYIGVGFSVPRTNFWHIVFPKAGTRQAVRSSQTGALVVPGPRFDRPQQ